MPATARIRRLALGVALLHAVVAAAYVAHGVTIRTDFEPNTWDFFWQNLPAQDLSQHALQSLWYLHAQPPLWNALNAVLLKAFGAHQLEALQLLHVLLGSAIAGMAAWIAAELAASTAAGCIAGALVALDPALVLFEAWALYELLSAFLIMLGLLALLSARPEGRTGPLLAALAALATLVLTRSLFHLALMVPAVVGAAAVARRRRTVLLWGTALTLLPAAWYGKNLAQHGFFGSSSWYGIGLWRVALFRYQPEDLNPLYRQGRLDPVVTIPPFSLPSSYRVLGYDRTSAVPSLSRDNFHNLNVPAISAAYGSAAHNLIVHAPLHFAANVLIGYGNFSAPSTEYDLIAADRDRMGPHVAVWRVLTGLPLVRLVDRMLPIGTVGSIFALLIPLGLILYLRIVGRRWREEPWDTVLREELPLIAAASLILYTTVVGSALELGENVRFKFMIEPLLLTFWVVLAVRLRRTRPSPN